MEVPGKTPISIGCCDTGGSGRTGWEFTREKADGDNRWIRFETGNFKRVASRLTAANWFLTPLEL